MNDIEKRLKLLEKEKEVLQELLDLYERLERMRNTCPKADPIPCPYPVCPSYTGYPFYTITSDRTGDVQVRFRQ